jgi:hypothetical protein
MSGFARSTRQQVPIAAPIVDKNNQQRKSTIRPFFQFHIKSEYQMRKGTEPIS